MTVYVTGRTITEGAAPLPGTIGATAEEVTARGGKGIAIAIDHKDDAAVEALFGRVEQEQGRLDILVNNAWAFPEGLLDGKPFWEKPLGMWDCIDVGTRSHYVASVFAARMMVKQRSGLIVNTSSPGGGHYSLSVTYGVGKIASDRMAMDMAHELAPHNVAALSLWLGLIRTERTMAALETYPGMFDITNSESQEFTGLMVAAFAKDPDIMKRSGHTYITAEIAREYGIADVDGSQPGAGRATYGAPPLED